MYFDFFSFHPFFHDNIILSSKLWLDYVHKHLFSFHYNLINIIDKIQNVLKLRFRFKRIRQNFLRLQLPRKDSLNSMISLDIGYTLYVDILTRENCCHFSLLISASFLDSSFIQQKGRGQSKWGALGVSLFQPATSITLSEYMKI